MSSFDSSISSETLSRIIAASAAPGLIDVRTHAEHCRTPQLIPLASRRCTAAGVPQSRPVGREKFFSLSQHHASPVSRLLAGAV
jgi:hypothetical protein